MDSAPIGSVSEQLRKLDETRSNLNLQMEEVRRLLLQKDESRGFALVERSETVENVGAPAEDFLRGVQESGLLGRDTVERLIETFGSPESAANWLRHGCGDLNNLSPVEYLRASGNEAEISRVLDCIDHGAFA